MTGNANYKTGIVQEGVVIGLGTLAVRVEDQHQTPAAQLDIGFVLNRDQADSPVLWDCVAGVGSTNEEAQIGLSRLVARFNW